MKKTTLALTGALVVGVFLMGCSMERAYVKIDHPKAAAHLNKDITLHYAVEPAIEGATVIEHITVTEHSTDCENATINALEKMQKMVVEKGGNALINLKNLKENKKDPLSNEKGWWCHKSEGMAMLTSVVSLYDVTWDGDIATIGAPAPAPAPEAAPAATADAPPAK